MSEVEAAAVTFEEAAKELGVPVIRVQQWANAGVLTLTGPGFSTGTRTAPEQRLISRKGLQELLVKLGRAAAPVVEK